MSEIKREHETRDTEKRETPWAPAPMLPSPDPKDGFEFLWVRSTSSGKFDNLNVSKKLKEGWVPCKAEDHPEIAGYTDYETKFKGEIEMGGMLLCERSTATCDQARGYQKKLAEDQMTAVDNHYMKDARPAAHAPLLKSERSSRFG